MKKIFIDTDVLGDVDDAVALAYAALNPVFDIKGITTVHGLPELKADFAKKLMIRLGKGEIPVAAGEKYSSSTNQVWLYGHEGRDVIGEDEHYPLDKSATELLDNQIRNNKNDISLLCIGPLTNIAKLIQEKPEITCWVNEIYFMGGAVEKNNAFIPNPDAYNVKVDPKAASIVFRAGIPIKIITKEDSKKIILDYYDFRELAGTISSWGSLIYHNAVHFMKAVEREYCYMYDPLTAIVMAKPELVRFEKRGHIYKSTWANADQVKKHLLNALGGQYA